jgi:hypothetical protein
LLDVFGKFNPEFAGQIGVEGLDEQIIDLKPDLVTRSNDATLVAVKELRNRLAPERSRSADQILIKSAEDTVKGTNLNENISCNISRFPNDFSGMRALLDDQIPAERRKAALIRLKRYAGMEPGYKDYGTAEARTRISDASDR